MNLAQTLRKCFILGPLFVAWMACTGCSSAPRKYDVKINAATPASVDVDIIGATASDLPDWNSYSINKYWQEGDVRRRDAQKVEMKTGETKQVVLHRTDTIWNVWFGRGVDHLVIIANLPGSYEDGPNDPRRKVLDLYPEAWKDGTSDLQIEIQESRINILTPAGPKK
jgi:hypothetical protein